MENYIADISALIGDPVRSKILWTLLDGRAYTASELAVMAETSPQNISIHLSKFLKADLLAAERQGRHRYYRFSRPEVAYAIEAIANLVPAERRKKITDHPDNYAIKYCRTCYDHLAGKVGVQVFDTLLKQKLLTRSGTSTTITQKGSRFFSALDINTEELKTRRRILAKPCLDWSERKHHLAGAVGAAFLDHLLKVGWVKRNKNSRAIIITSKGRSSFYELLKMEV